MHLPKDVAAREVTVSLPAPSEHIPASPNENALDAWRQWLGEVVVFSDGEIHVEGRWTDREDVVAYAVALLAAAAKSEELAGE